MNLLTRLSLDIVAEPLPHLGVMVGNMVGSSCTIGPAFSDIVDLDGPVVLAADRVPGIVYRDGAAWCPANI